MATVIGFCAVRVVGLWISYGTMTGKSGKAVFKRTISGVAGE